MFFSLSFAFFNFKAVETTRRVWPAALNPVLAVFATHSQQGRHPQAGHDERPLSRPRLANQDRVRPSPHLSRLLESFRI